MTPNQILAALQIGLSDTWSVAIDLSDDPDTQIRPEYLKTIAVAQALKRAASGAIVRLEQPTGQILGASLPPASRPKGFSTAISRPGEVDVLVSIEDNGWKYPLAIVENKRYPKGFSTISADVLRCLEFLEAQGNSGSLEVAAVTYFWRQESGLTKVHQRAAANHVLDKIERTVGAQASSRRIDHYHHRFEIHSTAFNSDANALAEDDDGMPAFVLSPPWTIFGCIEMFTRPFGTPRLGALPCTISPVAPYRERLAS